MASSLLSTHGDTVAAVLMYKTLQTDIEQGINQLQSEEHSYIKCTNVWLHTHQLIYRSYCFVLKLWWNNDEISVNGLVKGSKVSGPHTGLKLLPVLWHHCSHLMLKCFIIFGEFQKFSRMFEGETRDRSKRCDWSVPVKACWQWKAAQSKVMITFSQINVDKIAEVVSVHHD